FTIDNDKINVLEALGMAGDMTAFGKRENVMIIREIDGKRNMARLNLNNSDALKSPYFYLQQNDIIYVEPSLIKGKQANRDPNTIPLLLAAISVLTLVVSRFF